MCCPRCQHGAADFPEASEQVDAPGMPRQVVAEVLRDVRADEVAATRRDWSEVLGDELAARARAAAAEVLPAVLLRYGQEVIAQHGRVAPIEAVGEREWREVVGLVLEELEGDGGLPLAQVTVWTELRVIVASALRDSSSRGA